MKILNSLLVVAALVAPLQAQARGPRDTVVYGAYGETYRSPEYGSGDPRYETPYAQEDHGYNGRDREYEYRDHDEYLYRNAEDRERARTGEYYRDHDDRYGRRYRYRHHERVDADDVLPILGVGILALILSGK